MTQSTEQDAPAKISWLNQPRRRQVPWQRTKWATRILPPNEQRSNLALMNEQVMRARDEKISFAYPLNVGTELVRQDD